MAAGKTTAKTADPAPSPALQWVMAVLGGLMTAALVGVVIWEALQPDAPPALDARIVEVETVPDGYVAVVRVFNDGDDTAAAVDVEGRLDDQNATATVAYVPGHGHADAFLRFEDDPHSATVAVKGWSAP